MAKTNKHAVQIIAQVIESELKFVSIGSFLLKFFTLSIDMQEELANNLLLLSRNLNLNSYYIIKGFKVTKNAHRYGMNFIVEHSFKCRGCHQFISDCETNLFEGRMRELCEPCQDRAHEYESDSIANQLYD